MYLVHQAAKQGRKGVAWILQITSNAPENQRQKYTDADRETDEVDEHAALIVSFTNPLGQALQSRWWSQKKQAVGLLGISS